MAYRIKQDDREGFLIWLGHLGYAVKELPDGGHTFKNKNLNPQYFLITSRFTSTNSGCQKLIIEYKQHLAS